MEEQLEPQEENRSFEIITSRPEGMPYEDYKVYRKAQKKAIKKYLKGTIVHLSKLYPTTKVLQMLAEKEYESLIPLLTKGVTYIKPKDNESK